MLVLTRRIDETIEIGDLVEIRLIEANEDGGRLGIRFLKMECPSLKITLNASQSVEIGDHITVTAVRRSVDHIRIGVTAPPDVPIVRGEMRPPK